MRLLILTLCSCASFSLAAERDIKVFPSLTTGVTLQDSKPSTQDSFSVETINIQPSLSVVYESRLFQGSWNISHMHLIRDTSTSNFNDDFTTYNYSGDLTLVDNLLSLEVNGNQDLLNLSPSDFLVTDRFFNQDALTKTRTNSAILSLEANRFGWIKIDATADFSKVESEEQNVSVNNLSGTTTRLRSSISEGDSFDNLFFVLRSEFSITESDGDSLEETNRRADTNSRNIDGLFNHQLIGNFGLAIRGSNEGYRFEGTTSNDTSSDFSSLGAGFSYAPSRNRYIAVTLNKGDRDDVKENYVGADLRWAFSPRSSLEASIGRRYYGDSGNLEFNYNTRNIRSTLEYTERVTNFVQLVTSTESLGLFVCPPNSNDISTCFQPSTLSPTLEAGEQVVEFLDNGIEVSDEPILIKSTRAAIGYSKTRYTTSLEFRYSNPFYEETGREQVTYTTNWISSYELGPKTQIRGQITYSEFQEREGLNSFGQNFDDTIIRVSSSLRYEINEHFSLNTEIRLVDRDSDDENRKLRDRRISFDIVYNFR